MKLKMAPNSLFAVLLRSPWWISLALALLLAVPAAALLPDDYKVVGALSGFPLLVISAIAASRQWRLPSAARVASAQQQLAGMAWPEFSALLEAAFTRDGYAVRRVTGASVDFELERAGRRMLVSARRWKSARTGLEALRALQAAREADDVSDALVVSLGELTDTARPFAAQHRITVWQAAEIVQALGKLLVTPPAQAPASR